MSIRLADTELKDVVVAARRDGLAVGAWIADVAVVSAGGHQTPADLLLQSSLREVLIELNQARTQLAKAGGLLN